MAREQEKIYFSLTKRLQGIICIEIAVTVALLFVVNIFFVEPLWDQFYLDQVIQDWKQGPIVELKMIDAKEDCEPSTFGNYYSEDHEYEVVGQGYWWGMREGCMCNAGGSYPEISIRKCYSEELQEYCTDVPQMDPQDLPVVNNKQMCAHRDNTYNFMTTVKPKKVKLEDGNHTWQCNATSEFSQLCGSDDLPFERVLCIPSKAKCPLTSLEFNSEGKLETSRDPKKGLPLIDIRLSEGGPPCAHFERDLSSQAHKVKPYILPETYEKGCPDVNVGNLTVNRSSLFSKVEGFTPVSEVDLLKQNKEKRGFFSSKLSTYDYVLKIPRINLNRMRSYKYDMYERNYLEWSENCFYYLETPMPGISLFGKDEPMALEAEEPTNSTTNSTTEADDDDKEQMLKVKIPITPNEIIPITDESDVMIMFVNGLYYLLMFALYGQIFGFAMVFMHRNEALRKARHDTILYVRSGLSLAFNLTCVLCFWAIYAWSGHAPIEAMSAMSVTNSLGEKEDLTCTNDQVLIETFKQMKSYLDHSQVPRRKWLLYGLLTAIMALNLLGLVFKFAAMDPQYKKYEGERKAGKKKQLREKLIE